MKKKKLLLLLFLSFFSLSCLAALPLVVGFARVFTPVANYLIFRGWSRAVAYPVYSRLLELSVYAHAAVISIHFSNDSTSSSINSGAIHAILTPDETRQNPDPEKWNDAAAGSYDPTPKETLPRGAAGSTTEHAPSTYPKVVENIGGVGEKYYIYDSKNDIHYMTLSRATCTGYRDDAQSGYTGAWCGSLTVGAEPLIFAVYYRLIPTSCPPGYQIAGSACTLIDAEQVMKPADQIPCEVVFNEQTLSWEVDKKNPSCLDGGVDGSIQVDGNILRIVDQNFDVAEISRLPSGGYSVTAPTSDGGSREVITGPRTPDAGGDGKPGLPIIGITDKPPGSGTGGSGSSNNCGGKGQPSCSVVVDDSGFENLDPQLTKELEKSLDDRVSSIDRLKDQSDWGINASWVPSILPGPPVSCQTLDWPIRITVMRVVLVDQILKIDLCDKLEIFRQYYAWLFSFLTITAIVKLFFSSNSGEGSKK